MLTSSHRYYILFMLSFDKVILNFVWKLYEYITKFNCSISIPWGTPYYSMIPLFLVWNAQNWLLKLDEFYLIHHFLKTTHPEFSNLFFNICLLCFLSYWKWAIINTNEYVIYRNSIGWLIMLVILDCNLQFLLISLI